MSEHEKVLCVMRGGLRARHVENPLSGYDVEADAIDAVLADLAQTRERAGINVASATLADQNRVLRQRAEAAEAKLAEAQNSMIVHFQTEHLAGDGPEIERWKRTLRGVTATCEAHKADQAHFRERAEADLAGVLLFLRRAAHVHMEIVSTCRLSALSIDNARRAGNMYVEPGGGLGWVVQKVAPTVEWAEQSATRAAEWERQTKELRAELERKAAEDAALAKANALILARRESEAKVAEAQELADARGEMIEKSLRWCTVERGEHIKAEQRIAELTAALEEISEMIEKSLGWCTVERGEHIKAEQRIAELEVERPFPKDWCAISLADLEALRAKVAEAQAHSRNHHIEACESCAACTCERDEALDKVAALAAALVEISEGTGAFSRDPLTHATNCIEAMKACAFRALKRGRRGWDSNPRSLLTQAHPISSAEPGKPEPA